MIFLTVDCGYQIFYLDQYKAHFQHIAIRLSLADAGGAAGAIPTPKGQDSSVLTYKCFRNVAASGVGTPLRGRYPPTGNPGSATAYGIPLFKIQPFISLSLPPTYAVEVMLSLCVCVCVCVSACLGYNF